MYNLIVNVYFKNEQHFAAQPLVITGGVDERSVSVLSSGVQDLGQNDSLIPICNAFMGESEWQSVGNRSMEIDEPVIENDSHSVNKTIKGNLLLEEMAAKIQKGFASCMYSILMRAKSMACHRKSPRVLPKAKLKH